jgi:DNA-binding NtrC family response regulator
MAERLLIVDDEDTLCRSLQRIFRSEGYEVDIADSAEAACSLLESTTYDLIITDIILPGISGLELLARYRERHPDQKVVIMTAFGSLELAVKAIKAGARDFILKPLLHDELKGIVRSVLGKRGPA